VPGAAQLFFCIRALDSIKPFCIPKYNLQWHCNRSCMMETLRPSVTLEIRSVLAQLTVQEDFTE
jgi:hypothetical protein